MKKLLVPVDGSATAVRALRHAIEMARAAGDIKILAVNVQQAMDHWYVGGLLNPEAMAHLRQTGEAQVGEARQVLDASRLTYEIRLLYGHPAEVIVRVARDESCLGIVMGTRGLGGLENIFLGSTAYKVIQLAEVPVTLVK